MHLLSKADREPLHMVHWLPWTAEVVKVLRGLTVNEISEGIWAGFKVAGGSKVLAKG